MNNASAFVNETVHTIHARRSIGKLTLPMPNDDELHTVLQSALVAPDHKQLKPWRFWVLTGDALVQFGEVLLEAQRALSAQAGEVLDEMTVKKTLNMPLRAPMIIAVATNMKYHEKVPEFEQLLSAGAAVQNMLLTLESLGYKSVWRSGPLCQTQQVKAYFGIEDKDTLCALIYTGSSSVEMPCRALADVNDFVQYYR